MTYDRHVLSRRYRLFLSLVLALTIDWWVTIEWTWPNCGNGDQWLAAYGLPFPYTRWGEVSSMEYIWIPQIFALNLAVVAAMIFVALRWLPAFRYSRRVYGAVAMLASLNAAGNLLLLYVMMVGNVSSLAHDGATMFDLRPVAIHFDGDRLYECTPSHYWFGTRRPNSGLPAQPERASSFS